MQKEPVEGLFRAMIIVIMDNATAEYSFLRQFFNRDEPSDGESLDTKPSSEDLDMETIPGSPVQPKRRPSDISSMKEVQNSAAKKKSDDAYFDGIWKQVMEPILQYADVGSLYALASCDSRVIQSFIRSIVSPSIMDPKPSVVPILTMIRLNEEAYREVCRRSCGPMEIFLVGVRMQLWPVFQSEMGAHVDSLKALADSATGSMFARGNVRDTVVRAVSPSPSLSAAQP